MRNPESFIGQPIRSLQTMLRVIAENDPSHERIIPDGIYGPETVSAVSTFQRIHGIPVTGITDNQTWDTVVELYEEALVEQTAAEPLLIILNPGQVIRKGERHPQFHRPHQRHRRCHYLRRNHGPDHLPGRTAALHSAHPRRCQSRSPGGLTALSAATEQVAAFFVFFGTILPSLT